MAQTALAIKVGDSADAQLAQASVVEVLERMGEPTTFRMRYEVDITSGNLPLLKDGRLSPGSVIQVLSLQDNVADCLVKGPVHGQQIRLLHGGAGSYVDVLGSDTSVVMDREVKAKVWDSVRDSDVFSQIVAPYGFTPDAQDTPAVHAEAKHTLVQHDSDLRFVRRLARRNGCLFWVTADPTGLQTAHFRRPPLDGAAGAKLAINLGSPNLNALEISWDVERPSSSVGWDLDLSDKSRIDGSVTRSPQKVLGDKGLADITGDVRSTLITAPVDDAGDLKSRSEAALIESDFFVTVTGETTAHALGSVLRAHTVVQLQGTGTRHSGPYFVSSVRHLIDATTHRLEFELVRNGWGA
jgi:phage protein D